MSSIRLGAAESPHEILWAPDEQSSEDCYHPLFPGRFLWPFCDRIPGGSYTFQGNEYSLPLNDPDSGDAIHGFFYEMPVSIVRNTEGTAETLLEMQAVLASNAVGGYPFAGRVVLTFVLEPSRLTVEMLCRNTGTTPCPVSFGWHPYFQLPGTRSVDDLLLQTTADSFVPVDGSLKPTGTIEDVRDTEYDFREQPSRKFTALAGRELDIALTCRRSHEIETVLRSATHDLFLRQSGAFRFQQLFIPPSRQAIAIEPLTAAANAFNEPQLGLHVLDPGEELAGRFAAELRVAEA